MSKITSDLENEHLKAFASKIDKIELDLVAGASKYELLEEEV